jgi:hypothetical protein
MPDACLLFLPTLLAATPTIPPPLLKLCHWSDSHEQPPTPLTRARILVLTQHAMAEFEGSMHYLKGPGGLDVYPLFELPEKEACVGDMSMTQVAFLAGAKQETIAHGAAR